MNGSILKARLSTIESNLSETARKLNMSKQAFYQALDAADVKTGLIERLAIIYNRPIGFFFDDSEASVSNIQSGDGTLQNAGRDINVGINSEEHDELIRLREEVKRLNDRISDKESHINDLQASLDRERKLNDYLMNQK